MDDIFSQFFGGGGMGGGRGGGQHYHFGGGGGGFRGGRGGPGGGGFGGGFDDEGEGPKAEFLFTNTDVVHLNLASMSQFYRRKEIWIVLFYDPSNKDS